MKNTGFVIEFCHNMRKSCGFGKLFYAYSCGDHPAKRSPLYRRMGGAGFIGSVVVRRAVNEGHFVTNYDALTPAASLWDIWDLEQADNYQLVLGDISDRNKLKN
ncbi:hypothetical protein IMCC1933_12740 [Rhodobacteraceae bacterium IMCC1933]|nr:hypothetical protein [Rhodobacteraceae bacterium IMCC1923]MDP4067728.1 hypothetical protein [Rhodobacteraceae bacterium IMCC1933]MDP4070928.1 hypothetical protein [Rhodobacteraceae bacterium IMCC1909]